MADICKHFQSGYCRNKSNCTKRHIVEECFESNCNKEFCEKRHRKLCIYFEKYGFCKFNSFCEFKHEKPAHIIRIEMLEKKVKKYDEEYETFVKFFKKDIINKLI